jgi:hypothetical protein
MARRRDVRSVFGSVSHRNRDDGLGLGEQKLALAGAARIAPGGFHGWQAE